jgi:hypothetical protein
MKTQNKHRGRAQLTPGEDKLSDSHWLPSQNWCKHKVGRMVIISTYEDVTSS